jgi:hypothetical protein
MEAIEFRCMGGIHPNDADRQGATQTQPEQSAFPVHFALRSRWRRGICALMPVEDQQAEFVFGKDLHRTPSVADSVLSNSLAVDGQL